eukprot:CAMPEP_0171930524 /NCGR_PEP_ID=MMETSP0993-20121228/28669_1 /TAXON_ID=483369 /ORGANISM="non described non described, Strain CCMP2098" /LENGTH=472 /DNA_ID=CAMNT_0012570359 /DNA_START=92 /DNA_END=1510 /DNA_ORIENTATION=+
MSAPYSLELEVARDIVAHASTVARSLQGRSLVVQKDDVAAITEGSAPTPAGANPVTVADFTVQCLVLSALKDAFPRDRFIAEEDSAQLLSSGQATVAAVVRAVRAAAGRGATAATATSATSAATAISANNKNNLHSEEEVCSALDLGSTGLEGGWSASKRTWVLDPIDGTKGFVRGDQFAIALALLDNGRPVLGLLGCPNLPPRLPLPPTRSLQPSSPSSFVGSLFWAEKGHGAYAADLAIHDHGAVLRSGGDEEGKGATVHADAVGGSWTLDVSSAQKLPSAPPSSQLEKGDDNRALNGGGGGGSTVAWDSAVRLEAFESAHSSHEVAAAAAAELGMNQDSVVRLDGQGKYGLVARGDAHVFIRLPRKGYQECIWDHAAGSLIVQESGGTVTDLRGEALDFSSEAHKSSRGAKLSPKVEGIVATGSALKARPLAEGSGKGNGDDELSAHAELLLALDYATKPSGASGDARG